MNTLGVIPAGGKGSRWGGFQKMLLPIGNGQFMIDRVIEAMRNGGADAILVVPNAENLGLLANHLKKYENVAFAVDHKLGDMYSGIEASLPFAAERNLFAMPDTVFPLDAFQKVGAWERGNFKLGVHKTAMPERFGVVRDGMVINKRVQEPGEYDAWGLMVWSKECAEFWQKIKPENYTDAINLAIKKYGLMTFEMDYYHDMASFEDYREFICADKRL